MKKPVLYIDHAVFIVTIRTDVTVTKSEAQLGFPVNQFMTHLSDYMTPVTPSCLANVTTFYNTFFNTLDCRG